MVRVRVREIETYERQVCLRFPFRFGMVTLTKAPQLFVRARVALERGNDAWGMAAELLVPKWFDKNPAVSHEANFDQLRTSLALAYQSYAAENRYWTPFELFANHIRGQIEAGRLRGLNSLVAGYGPALLDRAVLDACCRALGLSFYEAIRRNLSGISSAELVPDLAGFDFDSFLATLCSAPSIQARHTVGLVDPLDEAGLMPDARLGDGLPETLEEVIRQYGNTYFKLKLGGEVEADIARLQAIARVLDRTVEPYFATLDGNEQYDDVERLQELLAKLTSLPSLGRLADSILFIEQPIHRARAFEHDLRSLGSDLPVIIDESDGDLDAFLEARRRGYRGVSCKTCKGVYKSLINLARCARWNAESGEPHYFMSGEDLSNQAGISVQQDLALVSLMGIQHVERNGHHYVNGMSGLPASEQQAFLEAHPDLYSQCEGVVRLRIEKGLMQIGSLSCPGFAVAATPDWRAARRVELKA